MIEIGNCFGSGNRLLDIRIVEKLDFYIALRDFSLKKIIVVEDKLKIKQCFSLERESND